MPKPLNHENDLSVIITGAGGDQFALGDGERDYVEDNSPGFNTISLGNGNSDAVKSFGSDDLITLGNGQGDAVIDYSTTGGNVISLGDGHDDNVSVLFASHEVITLGNGDHDYVITDNAYTGFDNTVVVGNGNGDIVIDGPHYFEPLGAAYDTIEVGSGVRDSVELWTSPSIPMGTSYVTGITHVTFGGPDATLDLSASFGSSFTSATTAAQTSVDTSRLDVIAGLVRGDHLVLPHGYQRPNIDTPAIASNLAGAVDKALFAAGTYSASAHTFTESATGHDVLLTFDDTYHHFMSVVLVGAAGEIAGATIHAGTITLG